MILNDAARQALTAGHLAHFVTLNPDGSPQISVVWVGLDGDEVVSAHFGVYKKLKNIQHDARVAISMETGGSTNGLANYLVISGHARITEGGAPELLHQLAQIYIGPGTDNFPPPNSPAGYISHVTVEHVHGVGPWTTQDHDSI